MADVTRATTKWNEMKQQLYSTRQLIGAKCLVVNAIYASTTTVILPQNRWLSHLVFVLNFSFEILLAIFQNTKYLCVIHFSSSRALLLGLQCHPQNGQDFDFSTFFRAILLSTFGEEFLFTKSSETHIFIGQQNILQNLQKFRFWQRKFNFFFQRTIGRMYSEVHANF